MKIKVQFKIVFFVIILCSSVSINVKTMSVCGVRSGEVEMTELWASIYIWKLGGGTQAWSDCYVACYRQYVNSLREV